MHAPRIQAPHTQGKAVATRGSPRPKRYISAAPFPQALPQPPLFLPYFPLTAPHASPHPLPPWDPSVLLSLSSCVLSGEASAPAPPLRTGEGEPPAQLYQEQGRTAAANELGQEESATHTGTFGVSGKVGLTMAPQLHPT